MAAVYDLIVIGGGATGLGAARAGEMIHEPALAMRAGMFTGRLAQTTHAYPTWSLAIQQTAAQFFGRHGGRIARAARPAPPSSPEPGVRLRCPPRGQRAIRQPSQ